MRSSPRTILFFAWIATAVVAAQDNATSTVIQSNSAAVRDIINLCYTVGALCGIIGAVVTYSKILNGQTESYTAIRNWFVACLTLLILPQVARAILGL